jgi:hypothetical protein
MEILKDTEGRHSIPTFIDCDANIPHYARNFCFSPSWYEEVFGRSPMDYQQVLNYSDFIAVSESWRSNVPLESLDQALTSGVQKEAESIFRRMKAIATENLGEEVKFAVVTVPAYYNDAQRVGAPCYWSCSSMRLSR